jgi:hypothetical protein
MLQRSPPPPGRLTLFHSLLSVRANLSTCTIDRSLRTTTHHRAAPIGRIWRRLSRLLLGREWLPTCTAPNQMAFERSGRGLGSRGGVARRWGSRHRPVPSRESVARGGSPPRTSPPTDLASRVHRAFASARRCSHAPLRGPGGPLAFAPVHMEPGDLDSQAENAGSIPVTRSTRSSHFEPPRVDSWPMNVGRVDARERHSGRIETARRGIDSSNAERDGAVESRARPGRSRQSGG